LTEIGDQSKRAKRKEFEIMEVGGYSHSRTNFKHVEKKEEREGGTVTDGCFGFPCARDSLNLKETSLTRREGAKGTNLFNGEGKRGGLSRKEPGTFGRREGGEDLVNLFYLLFDESPQKRKQKLLHK